MSQLIPNKLVSSINVIPYGYYSLQTCTSDDDYEIEML